MYMLHYCLLTVRSRDSDPLARNFLVVGQHDLAKQQGQVGIDGGRLQAFHKSVQRHQCYSDEPRDIWNW